MTMIKHPVLLTVLLISLGLILAGLITLYEGLGIPLDPHAYRLVAGPW